ncbi:hypothetical protein QE422_002111 [Chryseobacterium sp. SORGH_AS 447]|nr:hypothetical protein [Chryseobacterium sp. SORGH_AS_0447]MDQ1161743.1 hypothetical protein [Chryseobacterium sp. SORGH_AS_0447]
MKRNPAARNSKKEKDARSVREIRRWLNYRLEEGSWRLEVFIPKNTSDIE